MSIVKCGAMQVKCAALLLAIAQAALSGCAYTHIREDGSGLVVGILHFQGPETLQHGSYTRMRSVGLSLGTWPRGLVATVGYSDASLTLVNDNSCIALTAFQTIGDRNP